MEAGCGKFKSASLFTSSDFHLPTLSHLTKNHDFCSHKIRYVRFNQRNTET